MNEFQGKPETMSNILLTLLGKYLFNFKMEIHTLKEVFAKNEKNEKPPVIPSWEKCHFSFMGKLPFGKLSYGKMYIWEVAAWEIAHLGSCRLGKYPWEVAAWEVALVFFKYPFLTNTILIFV